MTSQQDQMFSQTAHLSSKKQEVLGDVGRSLKERIEALERKQNNINNC